MDLDLSDLINKLHKDNLLNDEFIKWMDDDLDQLQTVFTLIINEYGKFMDKKLDNKIIASMIVIASFLLQQDPESEAKMIIQRLINMQEEEEEKQPEYESYVNATIIATHLQGVQPNIPSQLQQMIQETLEGNKKIIHVLKNPIKKTEIELAVNSLPRNVSIQIMDWFHLESIEKYSPIQFNELQEWSREKLDIIVTQSNIGNKQSAQIFVRHLNNYEDIKRKSSTVTLPNGAIHFIGKARIKLCKICAMTYQGWHQMH